MKQEPTSRIFHMNSVFDTIHNFKLHSGADKHFWIIRNCIVHYVLAVRTSYLLSPMLWTQFSLLLLFLWQTKKPIWKTGKKKWIWINCIVRNHIYLANNNNVISYSSQLWYLYFLLIEFINFPNDQFFMEFLNWHFLFFYFRFVAFLIFWFSMFKATMR